MLWISDTKMEKKNWVWMGHAGHFICARDCQFVLNTYIGKYIVSTVGELWSDRIIREIHAKVNNPEWLRDNKNLLGDNFNNAYMKEFGFQELGYKRTYETMVFEAKKSEHKCCPYEIIVEKEVDMEGYNTAEEAYK
ncbi:hypothetical protein LCGC14_1571250, partial [marine sediment metagenome]